MSNEKIPRMTDRTKEVLYCFLNNQNEPQTGYMISMETKIKSGSLYPILNRLEEYGCLESKWDSNHDQSLGRPRKRFYKLTAKGIRVSQKFEDCFSPEPKGMVPA